MSGEGIILTRGGWTLEFNDYGGYDSMSAAYIIKGPSGRRIMIDVAHFIPRDADFEMVHGENAEARALAELILRALPAPGQ